MAQSSRGGQGGGHLPCLSASKVFYRATFLAVPHGRQTASNVRCELFLLKIRCAVHPQVHESWKTRGWLSQRRHHTRAVIQRTT